MAVSLRKSENEFLFTVSDRSRMLAVIVQLSPQKTWGEPGPLWWVGSVLSFGVGVVDHVAQVPGDRLQPAGVGVQAGADLVVLLLAGDPVQGCPDFDGIAAEILALAAAVLHAADQVQIFLFTVGGPGGGHAGFFKVLKHGMHAGDIFCSGGKVGGELL